ncbi:DUF4912 domain-containing protein [Sneathia sanguinegens]|jgi:hypothetical protein|uniref:DUF4912 domain-containing protein n=1 Tax=Sneathia sanguinegens TaxID=40543 RepID=UPI002912388A|nr:DUF4912 domain-containing protein [Sneathia sanguinegens]MDU7497240.1 DUF4912 domain-containing protein [Sneathia sanguinegens]
MRTSRNYYSTKLIQSIPVRVRRKPGYLKKLYLKYDNEIKNVNNEEFLKTKYSKGTDKFFDKAPLPNRYYTNEIALLPKNITTLYAYWEIREDTFEHLKKNFNVFDQASILLYKNGQLFRKIHNISRFGSYYILNVEADKKYHALLGFFNPENHFFTVAKSTTVISPSGKVSNRLATVWGLPYWLNGQIFMNKYNKENLPNNSEYISEILDNMYLDSSFYENKNIRFGSSEKANIRTLGSSKLGSSERNL